MEYAASPTVLNPAYIQCSNEATIFYMGETYSVWVRDRCKEHTLDHAAPTIRFASKEARDVELLRRSL